MPGWRQTLGSAEADALQHEAMRIWWEREATLWPRLRRAPDALDIATGTWGSLIALAEQVLAERGVRPTEAMR